MITPTARIVSIAFLGVASCANADTADVVQAVYRDWMAPRAAEFAADSARLTATLQSLCTASAETADVSLQQARHRWQAGLASWERLSAVAIGPVLERRSQRQIDFSPTRPHLIEKAVKSAPASAADMELIGTPAKGLPALEWLLWVRPAKPGSPECRYAAQVAAEVGREAVALDAAFRQEAKRKPENAAATIALSELINQWVGGMQRLRWTNMAGPVQAAAATGRDAPDFPRNVSDSSATGWSMQWEALRNLAVGNPSLESALRQRGHAGIADKLVRATRQADAGMNGLPANDPARILAAAQNLATLERVVEAEVAPALGVNIGFSDADGD